MKRLKNKIGVNSINSRLNIRSKHEVESCYSFLSIYNSKIGKNVSFLKQGDPNNKEPDCICNNDIAIEIVGAYGSQYQAEKIWNNARGRITQRNPEFLLLTLGNLENEIGKKLQKLNNGNYDGFTWKIILVCNLHSPLLEDHEIEGYIKSYSSFYNDGFFRRYFHEIWVSWKSVNGSYKIDKLEGSISLT